jgi:hypothetical protein
VFFKINEKFEAERSFKILIYINHNNLDSLFKLETNINYKIKKILKIDKLKKITRYYNFKNVQKYHQIQKVNLGSKIYFLNNLKNKIIIRSALNKESKQLEEQCLIASEVKRSFFIKPLKNLKNLFVTKYYGLSFISYQKLEGNIYDGNPKFLETIFKSAITFLNELKNINKKKFKKIKKNKYNLNKEISLCKSLLNKDFIKNLYKKKHISLKTKKMILSNQQLFKTNFAIIKRINIKRESLQIVHNDLNHSNIILLKNKVKFIDIEDICLDYLKQAVAHLFFKITRHSIFTNKVSLNEFKKKYLLKLIKIVIKDNKIYKSRLDLYQFCILRILSDIANILEFYKIKRDKKYMYDLEKRIHNLFEVYYILY